MTFNKNYEVDKNLKIAKIAVFNFFVKLKFGVLPKQNSFIIIRGFKLSNPFTENPLNWKSRISAELEELADNKVMIKMRFEVTPAPNQMGRVHVEKWEKFIRLFEQYVIEDVDNITEAQHQLKPYPKGILKQVMGLVIFILITVFVILILSDITQVDLKYAFIALIPLGVLLYAKFDDRLKKT